MFNKKRQSRVEVSFLHGEPAMPKVVIEILPGQKFEQGIESDVLMEGNTILKAYNWRAGYTVIYEYFYV